MRVFSSPNTLMVDHLRHVLEGEGIACAVQNRFSASAAGEIPPAETWTELWILDETQRGAAEALVREAIADTAAGPAWRCAACGAEAEGQYARCWRCGAARGALARPADFEPVERPRHSRRPRPAWHWLAWAAAALLTALLLSRLAS